VRYAPGSAFAAHVHTGGEEYLVLDGDFQDEHGDFPAGSYVRNPPGSRHTPRSDAGCTIFVKLWQFAPDDRTPVHVDTATATFAVDRPGVEALPLFRDHREQVSLERWAPGAAIALNATAGLEILVLDGGFTEGAERFETQSWLRLPVGAAARVTAGADGARVWIKRGHLAQPIRTPGS
jgi:anti-sigma factor ChrR (cupin superfamily)